MTLQPGNPMSKVLVSVVAFEVIVFGLAFPGMILVSGTPLTPALSGTVIAVGLALASAFTLRRPLGYYLGWATQAAGILLGLLTPWMYAMGAVFALIWSGTFLLGRKLEQQAGNAPD